MAPSSDEPAADIGSWFRWDRVAAGLFIETPEAV